MMTIGLTGPSGSGKGMVASLFAKYGIPAIDTDAVYHRLLVPPSSCLDALVQRFGKEILHPDGRLNRPALAFLVFAPGQSSDLADLNRIAHEHILREVRRMLADYEKQCIPAVLVDAPQLFESGFDKECTVILSVLASREVRFERIMERDGLTRESANARMNAQKDDAFFEAHSHHVLYNNGPASELDTAVRQLLISWGVYHEI